MAGPFGNPNSAAELSVQAPSPQAALPTIDAPQAPSTIGEIASVVNAVAPSINAAVGTFYEGQLKTELQSVEMALRAKKDPWMMQALMASDASKDPVVRGALDELKDMGLAVRKGRLSTDYAMDRMEQIVSSATAKVPAYEKELTAAARSYLGFDPHAAKINDLLQPDPAEVQAQKDALEAQSYGITVDQLHQSKLMKMQMALQLQQIQLQKGALELQNAPLDQQIKIKRFQMDVEKHGMAVQEFGDKNQQNALKDFSALTVQEANVRVGDLISNALSELHKATLAGGVTNVEEVKQNLTAQFNAIKVGLTTGPNIPKGFDPRPTVEYLDEQLKGAITLIEAADKGKIDLSKNTAFREATMRDAYKLPAFGKMLAIAGPQRAMEVMDFVGRMQSMTPAAALEFQKSGKEGSGALSILGMLSGDIVTEKDGVDAIDFYSNPNANKTLTEVGRRAAVQLGIPLLSNPKKTGTEIAPDLGQFVKVAKGEEFLTVAAMPSVVLNLSSKKELHGQLIQQYVSNEQALHKMFMEAVTAGVLDPTKITVTDGVIRLSTPDSLNQLEGAAGPQGFSASAGAAEATPVQDVSVAQGLYGAQTLPKLQDFMTRLFIYGNAYKNTGVLPDSVYQSMDKTIGQWVQEAAAASTGQSGTTSGAPTKETPVPLPNTTIKYTIQNGKAVRIQ